MPLIHKVEFKHLDIKKYLNSLRHWVYCSDNNTPWQASNVNQAKIYERLSTASTGHLQFHRFASEPNDTILGNLRPRIEIVPVHGRLPKLTPLHIQYVVSFVEGGPDFRGLVFQIMDHTNTGGTLPVFQFEMRYGGLHTRWCTVNSDSSSKGTGIFRFATPKWNAGEWHTLDVYGYLSHIDNGGYFRVYHNGQFVWDRRARNASQSGGNPQLQYGIYGVAGYSLKTHVKSLLWETVDTIPMTQSIY